MTELRNLPRPQLDWERDADVVVVGSGAAGMTAALAAARGGRRVLLLTKQDIGGGATPLAQGGLAAAIGPGDSPALHQQDTLEAGAGLCDPAAVAALVSPAPAEIARLAGQGARLERGALHLEGGHHRSRIVTAGGDAIGAEVHRVLRAALLASPVQVLTHCVALDALIAADGSVGGVVAGICGDDGSLRAGWVTARAVVLATGGFGQAYATTTNPDGLTGDGLALAARAGAELRDVEFVQFHPTVLWQQAARGHRPLITEALRGAGAVLIDAAGRPVMAGRHPQGDLAPRDVVAAAMAEHAASGAGPGDHLWLDATALGRAVLEREFPTVTAACRARGIDPVTGPIPVAPGAHYACGGIRAGLDGQTSVRGLYAVGEAASTGVHGANRLASNSLIEALIFGRRAGNLLGQTAAGPARPAAAAAARPGGGPRDPAGPGRSDVPARRSAARGRRPGRLPAGAGTRPARQRWRAGRHPGPGHGRGDQPAFGRGRWSRWPPWPARKAAAVTGGVTCRPPAGPSWRARPSTPSCASKPASRGSAEPSRRKRGHRHDHAPDGGQAAARRGPGPR